jgi:two-component system phosphorelay protein LuxU
MSEQTVLILNPKALDKMKSDVGEAHLPVLLGCFIGELEDYIVRLTASEQLEKHCADISHSLKSSAASFGADALLQVAIQIDTAVKRNQTICNQETKNQLIASLELTLEEYLRYS